MSVEHVRQLTLRPDEETWQWLLDEVARRPPGTTVVAVALDLLRGAGWLADYIARHKTNHAQN